MSKISRDEVRETKKSTLKRIVDDSSTFKPTSYSSLKPGNIITCKYDNKNRLALVIKTERTQSGLYTSSRGNKLLTIFLLDGIREDKLQPLVNMVYKEKNLSQYRVLPKLRDVKPFGINFKQLFRTFNVIKIERLASLKISAKDLFKR